MVRDPGAPEGPPGEVGPEKPSEVQQKWPPRASPSLLTSATTLVQFEGERMAGLRVGQAEATSVRLDNMGWSLSPRTCDMTSRDQLSVMEMGWLGLAGSLLSFSEGRSSVGPKTVARLCRDILFTVSFSATLRRAEVEGAIEAEGLGHSKVLRECGGKCHPFLPWACSIVQLIHSWLC